jgi:hypothetical protein
MRVATTTSDKQQLSWGALLWIGPLTILACICANSIVRFIAVMFLGVSAAFQPLQLPTIIVSTVVYLLLAIGALLLVSRMSARPVRAFRVLATVCLLVSLLFPLMAMTGIVPTPDMTVTIFWSMVAMHIISAIITIALLPHVMAVRAE